MMAVLSRRSVPLLLLVISFSALTAQDYRYEIGGMAGGSFYMGDANRKALFRGTGPSAGVVVRYNPNFRLSYKGNLLWGQVSGDTDQAGNVFPGHVQTSFSRQWAELGAQIEFNFFPYNDKYAYMNTKRFTPYVLAGLGVTAAFGSGDTFAGLSIPLGLGVKYKIKSRLNAGCEFSFRKLFGDNLEGNQRLDDPYHIKGNLFKNRDWYSCLLLSITWDFGPCVHPCNNAKNISW